MKLTNFHFTIGLIFSISKNPEIQVDQTLFFKSKLGLLKLRVFDCHVGQQITKANLK